MTKAKGKNTASRGSGEAEKVNNPSSLQGAEGDEEYASCLNRCFLSRNRCSSHFSIQ